MFWSNVIDCIYCFQNSAITNIWFVDTKILKEHRSLIKCKYSVKQFTALLVSLNKKKNKLKRITSKPDCLSFLICGFTQSERFLKAVNFSHHHHLIVIHSNNNFNPISSFSVHIHNISLIIIQNHIQIP